MLKQSKYKSSFTPLENKFLKGFTLTELLVAIAIIGILSAMVLTSMSSVRERAKDGRRISDLKQIQLALELYYDVNTSYPTNIYSGEPLPLADFLKISKDPDGTEYKYAYLSSGQDYHLGAVLRQFNQVLNDDDDAGGGFDGNSSDCAGTAGDDMCYDLTP